MKSNAKNVAEYLADLPDDRREAIAEMRFTILDNLPDGYQEVMGFGMIAYVVPLDVYPDTYNGQPLTYAALASQKNHMSVYLMSVYGDPELEEQFRQEYTEAGKKLDMGKSCVRFKRLDDVPLDVIGHAIAATSVEAFVASARASRER